ncbi:hypothetical protein V8E36_000205 [Tilletia maclaganii]
MPPRQTVSFSGPSLPPFLARLQAQVQGSSTGNERQFDPHLEARRKAKREEVEERKRKRAESGRPPDPEDEDDEFDGAQVVVLDEENDLSREQALKGQGPEGDSKVDPRPPAPSASSSQAEIATPGLKRKAEDQAGPASSKSAKGKEGLNVLSEEIAKQKRSKDKADAKEKERKEKNKRAAKEKKKAGKGLSFDI